MDFRKVAAVAAIGSIISIFIPWFSFYGDSERFSFWDFLIESTKYNDFFSDSVITVVLIVVLSVAVLLCSRTDKASQASRLAGFVFIFIYIIEILRSIDIDNYGENAPTILIFIPLICAILLIVSGFKIDDDDEDWEE